MRSASGARQSTLARDAFSLAHFPLLCGIIGVAAAIEESIAHPNDPLPLTGRAALGVGLLLFTGGSALAEWRAAAFPGRRAALGVVTALAVLLVAAVHPWVSLTLAVAGTLALVLAGASAGAARGPDLEPSGAS
jgi:low temperature requirement protein LtrA